MSIEIKGLNNLPIHDTCGSKVEKEKGPAVDAKANANAASSADASEDSVKLTNFGRTVSSLESKIDKISEVDHKKVEAIKQAIANGEYKVDADSIATKMLRLESLLPK